MSVIKAQPIPRTIEAFYYTGVGNFYDVVSWLQETWPELDVFNDTDKGELLCFYERNQLPVIVVRAHVGFKKLEIQTAQKKVKIAAYDAPIYLMKESHDSLPGLYPVTIDEFNKRYVQTGEQQ